MKDHRLFIRCRHGKLAVQILFLHLPGRIGLPVIIQPYLSYRQYSGLHQVLFHLFQRIRDHMIQFLRVQTQRSVSKIVFPGKSQDTGNILLRTAGLHDQ